MFLTLDAGTSGGRAALFDSTGRLLAVRSCPWSYETPADAAPWGREFDATRVWNELAGLVRQTLAGAGARPQEILAVSVTGQRQGFVLLDAQGAVLYAGPNADLRAVYQAAEIDERWGAELYAISGHQPALLFAPARLWWLKEQRPAVYARVATLLMIGDWLLYCLCGETCSEASAAAESQLFDVGARAWSKQLAAALDLPETIFPPLRQAGDVVGTVTSVSAAATGLAAGTPVVVGGADTQAALLGMNVVAPGAAGIVAGWSMPVQQVTTAPRAGGGALWTTCHMLPDRWLLESNAGPAGHSYAWLRRVVFGNCDWAELEALADRAPVGAGGALAYLGAQAINAADVGLQWGGFLLPLGADFIGVERESLARAGLENIAFAAHASLMQVSDRSGQPPVTVAVGGGLTRSRLFRQLLADVLGAAVGVAALPETSCLGAAMAAAVGAGLYPDLASAASAMSCVKETVEPRRVPHAEYLDLFERWQAGRRHLDALDGM